MTFIHILSCFRLLPFPFLSLYLVIEQSRHECESARKRDMIIKLNVSISLAQNEDVPFLTLTFFLLPNLIFISRPVSCEIPFFAKIISQWMWRIPYNNMAWIEWGGWEEIERFREDESTSVSSMTNVILTRIICFTLRNIRLQTRNGNSTKTKRLLLTEDKKWSERERHWECRLNEIQRP